ncbi:MAG: type 4a pilus biogenesis protein PilO [Candidatus Daviesbacteria bacterium]|nr:type 4a pilus biogenesis protein PilO [Candidatus Daviesbacteria bacterium]
MATSKYSRYYVYIKPVITNKYVRSFAPYIFSLASLIIFIIFAIRPTIVTIIELQKSIQDNQAVLVSLQKKSEDLTTGKRNIENLDPDLLVKINNRLPKDPGITNLINNLQTSAANIASVSALQVQPVTIYTNATDPNSKQSIDEIAFSLNTQGSYTQLLSILENLNKTSRFINLTNAVINKSAEGGTSLSITGKGYYLKQ